MSLLQLRIKKGAPGQALPRDGRSPGVSRSIFVAGLVLRAISAFRRSGRGADAVVRPGAASRLDELRLVQAVECLPGKSKLLCIVLLHHVLLFSAIWYLLLLRIRPPFCWGRLEFRISVNQKAREDGAPDGTPGRLAGQITRCEARRGTLGELAAGPAVRGVRRGADAVIGPGCTLHLAQVRTVQPDECFRRKRQLLLGVLLFHRCSLQLHNFARPPWPPERFRRFFEDLILLLQKPRGEYSDRIEKANPS